MSTCEQPNRRNVVSSSPVFFQIAVFVQLTFPQPAVKILFAPYLAHPFNVPFSSHLQRAWRKKEVEEANCDVWAEMDEQ